MKEYDTKKMSVEDIRQAIINEHGLSQGEVDKIKGKSNLVDKLFGVPKQTINSVKNPDKLNLEDEGNIEMVQDEVTSNDEPSIPLIHDKEWSDYVLNQLTDDEKERGYPTVDGLRRLTEKLIGPIVRISTQVVQSPTPDNEKRATVIVDIDVIQKDVYDERHPIYSASGAADCYYGNTDEVYRNHPVAVAETRAEGRALKRLLRLKKPVAEEIPINAVSDTITGTNVNKVSPHQLQYLEIACRDKYGINITKLFNKLYPELRYIKELEYDQMLIILKELSTYQSMGVPESLKGYNDDWKQSLVVKETIETQKLSSLGE